MVVHRSSFLSLIIIAAFLDLGATRAVNISNVWLLPEEGYPVFYRYFRDRITWFEADAVCQFHHANLVTVDSSQQYDATRAYLKELDVTTNVWIGLKRSGTEGEFTWTDYKPLENGGYWQEQIPMTNNPVCAALDPTADFRWHPLGCAGPEVASFICQLDVPGWARKEDGCMLTSLPSLTVSYLPEQGAVELISDCGLEGTRRIACKGQANRDEMMKQLSCESSTEGQTEAPSSTTWDNELPTRHRRDTEITTDHHFVPTTEGLTEVDNVEVTKDSPPAQQKGEDVLPLATEVDMDADPTQGLPQEMSVAEEPIKSAVDVLTDDISLFANQQNDSSLMEKYYKDIMDPKDISLNTIARLTSDEAVDPQSESKQSADRRLSAATQSKPIPPSLRGNSPFMDAPATNNKTDVLPEVGADHLTQRPMEKESHEVFRESKVDIQPDKPDTKQVNFPPLSIYNVNTDPDDSSSRMVEDYNSNQKEVVATTKIPATTSTTAMPAKHESNDTKFFTRVVVEELSTAATTTTTTGMPATTGKPTNKPNTDNDFFVATGKPIKVMEELDEIKRQKELKLASQPNSSPTPKMSPTTTNADPTSALFVDDVKKVAGFSSDQEMGDEAEPEAPERPNRGRLLVKPQHHSFYPYFLNRVLG